METTDRIIKVGSTIMIQVNGVMQTLTICHAASDPDRGQISKSTPVARVLLGRCESELIRLATPAGPIECQIVKVL